MAPDSQPVYIFVTSMVALAFGHPVTPWLNDAAAL
jgi:hypothetical protein